MDCFLASETMHFTVSLTIPLSDKVLFGAYIEQFSLYVNKNKGVTKLLGVRKHLRKI